MMHPLKFIVVFLCAALLSIYPFPAFAQYQYQLTPSIAVSEEYNDNINAGATDEVSDYITGLTPGISFDPFKTITPYHFDLQKTIYIKRIHQIIGWYLLALFLILFSTIMIR